MGLWPWSNDKPEQKCESSDDLSAQLEESRRKMKAARSRSERVQEEKQRQIDTLNEATNAAHMKTLGALTPDQVEALREALREKLAGA